MISVVFEAPILGLYSLSLWRLQDRLGRPREIGNFAVFVPVSRATTPTKIENVTL